LATDVPSPPAWRSANGGSSVPATTTARPQPPSERRSAGRSSEAPSDDRWYAARRDLRVGTPVEIPEQVYAISAG
jgi:hypothetical protein